jgi:hypothetical protein
MVGSSGSATCSQPATCSGDQHHRNLASTTARSRGLRPACTAWGGPPAGRRPRQHAGPDSGGGRRCGPAPATPLTLPVPAGGRSSGRSHRRRYPGLVSSRSAAESERAARWGGRCCTRRSATQGPAPRARACPSDGRSAAATHLVATAARAPPALGPTVPRIAPTTSTADLSVSAEAMQPPPETAVLSATAATLPAPYCEDLAMRGSNLWPLPCEGSAAPKHTDAAPCVAPHQSRSTTLPRRGRLVLRVAL